MNKNGIILVVYGVLFLIGLFFLIKNNNTFNQHIKINHAIFEYHRYCIYNKPIDYNASLDVDYCDEESYDKTLFRLFDWGCENILPKEKYNLVKQYIK